MNKFSKAINEVTGSTRGAQQQISDSTGVLKSIVSKAFNGANIGEKSIHAIVTKGGFTKGEQQTLWAGAIFDFAQAIGADTSQLNVTFGNKESLAEALDDPKLYKTVETLAFSAQQESVMRDMIEDLEAIVQKTKLGQPMDAEKKSKRTKAERLARAKAKAAMAADRPEDIGESSSGLKAG